MKLSRNTTMILTVLSLLLMVLILIGYYLFHHPVTATQVALFLHFIKIGLAAFWIISLAGGLGTKLLPLHSLPALERLTLQAALGSGILSTGILIFGLLFGKLNGFLVLLAAIPAIFLWKSILVWWRQFTSLMEIWSDSGPSAKAILIICIAILFISLLSALVPATAYDALTYHFALPKVYLQADRILPLANWLRAGMPQTGEMLYTWALRFDPTGSAAALTGRGLGIIALIGLAGFIRRYTSTSAGLVGVGAILAGSSTASALGWGYIDWICLLFGVCVLISLTEWWGNPKQPMLLMAGIFCGLAFATKYTGGVILFCVVIALLWMMLRRKEFILGPFLILCIGFLIPSLPWLIKNLVVTGNPLYPLVFAGGSREHFIQSAPAFGNWLDIIALPIRATISGIEGGEGYSHAIGPIFLTFGLFAWLFRPSTEAARRWRDVAFVISLSGIVFWVIANQFNGLLIQTRLYYVLFPAFACIAAAGYMALEQTHLPGLKLGLSARIILLLVLFLNLVLLGGNLIQRGTLAYLSGFSTVEEYKDKVLGVYSQVAADVKSSEIQTLMLYEPRSFDCLPYCQPDEMLDRWQADVKSQGSCQLVLDLWRSAGVERVLVNDAGLHFFELGDDPHHPKQAIIVLKECVNTLHVLKDYGGAYKIYSLDN